MVDTTGRRRGNGEVERDWDGWEGGGAGGGGGGGGDSIFTQKQYSA